MGDNHSASSASDSDSSPPGRHVLDLHGHCNHASIPLFVPATEENKPKPEEVTFYRWPSNLAQTLLTKHLVRGAPAQPIPLYNRILAPQNSGRHCLYAATFPPGQPPENNTLTRKHYTVLFADRSRKEEAQIWIYNSLASPPPDARGVLMEEISGRGVNAHIHAAVRFLKETRVEEARGWPFDKVLKFAGIQPVVAEVLKEMCSSPDAIQKDTEWVQWLIPLADARNLAAELTRSFKLVSPVPAEQLDVVIATSEIPRQRTTLMGLPSSGLLDEYGKLVAWCFVNMDGSLSTLYVLGEHRKKGLAKAVAADLICKLHDCTFSNLGGLGWESDAEDGERKVTPRTTTERMKLRPFGMGSGFLHAEIKEGNVGSEKVVQSLGGYEGGESRYIFLDSDMMTVGEVYEDPEDVWVRRTYVREL